MRPWQAIVLILVLFFLAISSGWSDLYKLTYVLLTLFVLSWLWARYSLRKLIFHRNIISGRVQVGEIFEERLMLDNTSIIKHEPLFKGLTDLYTPTDDVAMKDQFA